MTYRHRLFAALVFVAALPALPLIVLGKGFIALGIFLLSCLAAWFLAGLFAAPLAHLRGQLRELNDGALDRRLLLVDDSEWSQVASEINQMADRLAHVTQTLEKQVAERTVAFENKASQLRAVGEVGRQVAAVLETDHLLEFAAKVVRGTFAYDAVAVLLHRGDELELSAVAVRGRSDVQTGGHLPLEPAWPVVRTALSGQAEVKSDPGGQALTPLVADLAAGSELVVPITVGGRVIGVLVAQSRQAGTFVDDDRFTLQTLAGQLAVALENGRLLAAERQLRDLAVTEERNRFAREIHDTLAQGFMGILMQLRAAQQVLDSPEDASFHLTQAEALATANLQEARRSVWNLRPRPLEGRTLGEALAEEVALTGQRAAFDARFQQQGEPGALPPAAETVLLRCAQEALNNATKYSHATTVDAVLIYEPHQVTLTVQDNGQGFDPASLPTPEPGAGGFGLHAMADRARTVGGTVTITSAPGQGARVQVQLPLQGGSRS